MHSAGGLVEAYWEVDIYVADLDIIVPVFVLENSPSVLSLGKLIDDHDLEYTWKMRRNI